MTTTHTDLTAICDAAVSLALAMRFDQALRLLDGTTPTSDDITGRLRLALAAADPEAQAARRA